MKKSLVMLTFLGLATGVSYAQKQTTVKIQETQARILDVSPNAYVKPLTVELKVDTEGAKFLGNVDGQILTREAGGRVVCNVIITNEEVEGMNGNIENMRSYALFQTAQLCHCDVIVAATFNLKTRDEGDGYVMKVVGYPASFTGWATATQQDYQWIQMEKVQTTSDREKIQAVIKR